MRWKVIKYLTLAQHQAQRVRRDTDGSSRYSYQITDFHLLTPDICDLPDKARYTVVYPAKR
jgi:hypothetical protein